MTEKSGIQMLEEIWGKVDLLERRLANIELMMKSLLNNRGTSDIQIKPTISAELTRTTITPPSIKNIEQAAAKPPVKIGDPPVGSVPTNSNSKVKILGQIKNKEGRYVSGVSVKIFDASNQMVKETRTNKAGEWMSLLAPGKYKAEYFLENIISSSVNFSALPGQTMVRVAQPTHKEV